MKVLIYTTYGIRDPLTGLFVYVGQTSNYKKRIRAHLNRRKIKPKRKIKNIKTWLHDSLSKGHPDPEFVVLETVDTEDGSLISELKWVRKLKLEQHPLLNGWKIHSDEMNFTDHNEEETITLAASSIDRYLNDRKSRRSKPRKLKKKKEAKAVSKRETDTSLSRMGRIWLQNEDQQLLELYDQGMGGRQIAKLMHRSFRGICARLVKLGVVAERKLVRR